MPPIGYVAIAVLVLVAVVAAFVIGTLYRRKSDENILGSAKEQATKLLNDAMKQAEQRRKEAIIEAKDEAFKLRSEAEKEVKERRSEVQRGERRLDQKENALDKKIATQEKKEEDLKQRAELLEARLAEIEQIKERQLSKLEQIAGMSTEAAKNLLLQQIDENLTHEKAVKIAAYDTQCKEDCDRLAREHISAAISRCAADHASEVTVSVIPIANDDLKGRIIGREGRNIRALETATGVELIIDDTPEAITISSFDPVRREVARQTIEKLILDGRIHPARIEEMAEKCRKEVNQVIKREGEKAVMDAGVNGLHPDIVKLIGRLKYRTSYGQNVLKHSLEVSFLSGLLAAELGVNVSVARRAGLLHDIGKALDHEVDGTHVSIGVELAKKHKENQQVIHAIEAHHGDVQATTPLAFIVMAADAISAGRPGARRENLESYIKRLESLEEIGKSFEGVETCFALQAGREVRIMVKPDNITDDQIVIMARDIAKRVEDELTYPGHIKVNVIRESRATEYAK